MGDLTKNFSKYEFACPCGCGFDDIDPALVVFLQAVRDYVGYAIHINSGCRCETYNALKRIGGKKNSEHLLGKGVDISCENSRLRFVIIRAALQAGLFRIGVGSDFIHVGSSADHPKEVIWTY